MPDRCRRIGLTGGIGTGKSTVARYLADHHHLPILDADEYAREAVELGSPILQAIFDRYGEAVQLPDGQLNRQQLGEIIFNDAAEKRWLEGIIHPYVRDRFDEELQKLTQETIILVIPLLFEANLTELVTEIWVVSCSPEQQLQRVIRRDRLNESQTLARIANQLPLATKIAAADTVLDNSSTVEALYQQIDAALR